MSDPEASVIIKTHNRAGLLEGCLEAVVGDRSKVAREVLVVDNASTDGTRDVIEAAVRSDPRVRYVWEPRLGNGRALNAGTARSSGRFLLFTDDDVIVEDGWADALVAAFANERVGLVQGRTTAEWLTPPPQWLSGPHAAIFVFADYGDEPVRIPPYSIVVGSNLAVRRDALPGGRPPFDPTLGHRGRRYGGGEDIDLAWRIARSSLLWWEPAARARHRVGPDRFDWATVSRQHFGGGIATERVRRRFFAPRWYSWPLRFIRFVDLAALAWRGREDAPLEPADAFDAYLRTARWVEVGQAVELAFGRFPSVADWISDRFASVLPQTSMSNRDHPSTVDGSAEFGVRTIPYPAER